MTESSTNSFHRVSHDTNGASANERWASPVGKVPPDCRAKHVAVVMLLSSSCKNTSALMESIRGQAHDLDCACFLFAESSALDFPVRRGLQDQVRLFLWKTQWFNKTSIYLFGISPHHLHPRRSRLWCLKYDFCILRCICHWINYSTMNSHFCYGTQIEGASRKLW